MPELPEILLRAQEIDRELRGRTIVGCALNQPRCLNLPPDEFTRQIVGEAFVGARRHGKWVLADLGRCYLLLNLGMGGDILWLTPDQPLPAKCQAYFCLDDGTRLALSFWWFGSIHLVQRSSVATHTPTARLGPDALAPELSLQAFRDLLGARRTRIKALLLDQSKLAGIGNMYIHDILFRARLHPERPVHTLSVEEVALLWQEMRSALQEWVALGGSQFERGLHGRGGAIDGSQFLVGYKEGQPCPICGTAIAKIKTGGTSSYVCRVCQTPPG